MSEDITRIVFDATPQQIMDRTHPMEGMGGPMTRTAFVVLAAAAVCVASPAFAASDSSGDMGGALMLLTFLLACYFLPTIIAGFRHHHNVVAIGLVNLFFGWTLVGWVGALVWAVISLTTRERVIYVERERE